MAKKTASKVKAVTQAQHQNLRDIVADVMEKNRNAHQCLADGHDWRITQAGGGEDDRGHLHLRCINCGEIRTPRLGFLATPLRQRLRERKLLRLINRLCKDGHL